MPYIEKNRRKIFDLYLDGLLDSSHIEKGDLTYCIFKLGLEYMKHKDTNYKNLSAVVGAMSDSANEFRRRFLDTYEDLKIIQNGDIE